MLWFSCAAVCGELYIFFYISVLHSASRPKPWDARRRNGVGPGSINKSAKHVGLLECPNRVKAIWHTTNSQIVRVGVHQGSALSSYCFIKLMGDLLTGVRGSFLSDCCLQRHWPTRRFLRRRRIPFPEGLGQVQKNNGLRIWLCSGERRDRWIKCTWVARESNNFNKFRFLGSVV